jgi:glutathione S-transferase
MAMKLFVAPGACSLACHVAVHELGLPVEVVSVSLTDPQSPLRAVNPLGKVPTLQVDAETVITEGTAILPFLADLIPGTKLFAPIGSTERARIQAWLGYVSTEVHAGAFRAINRPSRYHADAGQQPQVRAAGLRLLASAMAPISEHLRHRPWLVGDRFTIADAYLGVFCGWMHKLGSGIGMEDPLKDYLDRYRNRRSVVAALALEVRQSPV